MSINIHDYIIEHNDIDWATILRDWAWLLPRRLTVWIMNRFGDLFLVFEDGSVQMLDVGGGTLEKVADSRDDFCQKIDEGDNANQWLMIPLIDRLVAAGKTLNKGQCYGYTISPILGGDYTVENSFVLPIAEQYGVNASIHQQLKDVPDGTLVEIVIKR